MFPANRMRNLARNAVFSCLQIAMLAWPGAATAAQAPPDSIALSQEDAARIRGIRVTSAIPQDDVKTLSERFIRTQVIHTGVPVGAGGIIGAIIGAAIADAMVNAQIKKRMELSALAWPTILESVSDFDFRREFWSVLDALLDSDIRFKVADKRYFNDERPYMDAPETVDGVPLDATLDLHTEFALGMGMKTLQVTTGAVLRSRHNGAETYRSTYTFTTPPVSSGEFQEAANRWAENKGETYRVAMRLAAQYSARMLWLDLLGGNAPVPRAEPARSIRASDLGQPSGLFSPEIGSLVEAHGEVFIVRDSKGNLRTEIRGTEFQPTLARGPAGLAPASSAAAAPASPAPVAAPASPPAAAARSPSSAQADIGIPMEGLRDLLPAN
jgi:hypothetical protein